MSKGEEGRCPGLMPRGGEEEGRGGKLKGGVLPCDLSHDACNVPVPFPLNRMTDACENITFPQLCLWAVIKFHLISIK